jgi:hypothetical protein
MIKILIINNHNSRIIYKIFKMIMLAKFQNIQEKVQKLIKN